MYYVEYKNMIDKDAQFQAWLGLDVLYTGMSLRVY